jgi:3-phosphoglycerate kinase
MADNIAGPDCTKSVQVIHTVCTITKVTLSRGGDILVFFFLVLNASMGKRNAKQINIQDMRMITKKVNNSIALHQ